MTTRPKERPEGFAELDVNMQIAQFLASGGKVQEIPQGVGVFAGQTMQEIGERTFRSRQKANVETEE